MFLSIVLGTLAGFAYALFIPLILDAIARATPTAVQAAPESSFELFGFEVSNPRYAAAFLLLCVLILLLRTLSGVLLQWVAIDATKQLRSAVYERVSQLPIIDLERIGASRIHSAIANDVPAVRNGAAVVPAILASLSSLLGLLLFLAYLNEHVFLFIAGVIVFGVASFQVPLYFGNRYFSRARRKLDDIQEGIRGLIYGAKELKLNARKRQEFVAEELLVAEDAYRGHSRKATLCLGAAMNYGNLIAFLALGATTFIVSSRYGIDSTTLTAIAMAMIYATGMLAPLLNSVSPLVRGLVALRALNRLLEEMPIETCPAHQRRRRIEQVCLAGVQFTYPPPPGGERGFSVGPIDLTLRQREITVIAGGNGSGKSTLGKILSLLYVAAEGQVLVNDELVTDDNRDAWRQSIAAIYADFHIFPKLYGVVRDDLAPAATAYLRKLDLDGKVSIAGGRFSTTALSEGQRRRLALLASYLEDKDVYVFDEWAADQDPQFKEVFYQDILSELRDRGKIVVVISHDDRFYDVADRLIRMEDGRIARQHYPEAPAEGAVVRSLSAS